MSGRITRRWIVAVAILVLVGLQVVAQSPASASTVPNTEVKSTESVFNSNANKRVDAKCPMGKKVIGGGARVNGARHVVITQQEPISTGSGDRFRAAASEDQVGFAGKWSVQAFAICADPLPGLQIVPRTRPAGSDPFQNVTARCPVGKQALGTGGRIDGGQGQVQLGTIAEGGPFFSNRSTATGTEDLGGFNGNWIVTAFTVCVTPNAFGDLRLEQDQTASNSDSLKIITVSCPIGTRVTGTAAFTSEGGNVEVVVPRGPQNDILTNVQAIGRSNTLGAGFWDMRVFALCAK